MNSLIPNSVISEYMSRVKLMGLSCEIVLSWLSENNFDDKSAWVHLMPWRHFSHVNAVEHLGWLVNIGLGNDLVISGIKR